MQSVSMDADILDIVAQRGGRARSACDLCRHKKVLPYTLYLVRAYH